jgi:Flp pilus assembly secretin CpaC
MSIVQTQTTSFKAQLYQGIHDLTTDVIKIALYTANADLNADTTVYSTTNEISATGTYSLGGSQLTPITVNTSGYTAYVGFPNIAWTGAITARCALIYNSSKGNKSIAVLDFGSDKTSTTTFTITMPANTATAALIRSSN